MALLPAVGAGGLYAEVGTIEGDVGTVYPEFQGDQPTLIGDPDNPDLDSPYDVPITTLTPTCGDAGIPMLVIELDGQARAANFEFRKDIALPFLDDRWMVMEINQPPVTLSGDNLKIFTTQFTGDYLEIRNARVIEGGIEDPDQESDDQWGPNSGQFVIRGGMDTAPNVPGIRGQGIEAWIHGATGERVTLESPDAQPLNIDISYQRTEEVMEFYGGDDPKLGFGLTDTNIDWETWWDDDERVQRGTDPWGTPSDDDGYFTCSDLGGVSA